MKKLKNSCHFINIDRMEKCQITNPPKFGFLVFWVSMEMEYHRQPLWKNWKIAVISLILIIWKNFKLPTPPKVWVSSFPSINRNGISPLAIMKELKNSCHFFNIDHMENFQITDPPKVWVSGFPSVDRNGISPSAIIKNWKIAAISLILIVWKNFKLPTPPKVWVSGFPSVDRNGISPLTIMKKLKNSCHFINIDHMEKFQIPDPPQSLGLWFSECRWKWNITIGHYERIEKWLPFL